MKKLIALILSLMMLTGCSLATAGTAGRHELVGVFVTVSREENGEKVDIWDEDAAGMKMISRHDLAGQKLYAKRVEGEPVSYEFPAGCGLSAFVYDVYDENGNSFRSGTFSPEMDVQNVAYFAGDPSRYELEAVIYAMPDAKLYIQVNPVYQNPDGEVYVLSDKPTSYMVAGGEGYSAILTQDYQADKGYTTYENSEIKLTLKYATLPQGYTVLEMDENHQLLRRAEFAPGELPETYTPGADAAYIILEAQAGEDATRTIYSPGDANAQMDTYYPGGYGLCIKGYTTIDWEGAK